MSEQQPEQTQSQAGPVGTGPAAPATPDVTPMTAAEVQAPLLAPEQEETAPKADAPKMEEPKMEGPKVDAPKVEIPKVETADAELPRFPGKVMIMSPGDRAWQGDGAGARPDVEDEAKKSGARRFGAMAAVVALAAVAGAMGGALATAGFGRSAGAASAAKDSAIEASVARIDADMATLKASLDSLQKAGMSQFGKSSERLDKLEKAQTEPAAKLAKLNDAVEKLRAAQAAAAAAASAPAAAAQSAAAKDITGSVTPHPTTTTAAAAPAPQVAPPKSDIARLPTVEGWVVREAGGGSALIEGRRGLYEVYAGDPIPGLGRVDAIRKQDGRWVVVTTKGLIVSR